MLTAKSVGFSMLSLLWAGNAEAHIQLQTPTARYVQDNNGLKNAPCGSGSRSGVVTKATAGQSLTVTWKESVSHAGHYRIAVSAKESDFVDPSSLAIPSPLPAWDLMDGIPDKTGTQTYSQTVQLPTMECPACVLQLIQVMSTGTDGTNTGSFSGVYHACADLAITGSGGAGGPEQDASSAGDARADIGARDLRGTGGVMADAVGATGGAGRMTGSGGGAGTGTGGSSERGGTPGSKGGDPDAGSAGIAGQSGVGGGAGYGGTEAAGTRGMGGAFGAGGVAAGGLAAGGSRNVVGGAGAHGGDTAGASAGSGGGGTGAGQSSTSTAGCSCRLARSSAPKSPWLWFALVAVWLGGRRARQAQYPARGTPWVRGAAGL